jgi:O-Antigen ligase
VTALYFALGIMGFAVFLALQPKVKALVSFILMMQFFDAGPSQLFGMYVWDYGAILMMVTGVEVYCRTPALEAPTFTYLTVLKIFLAWLAICFVWSVLVYRYPLLHTIKSARQMVVGYSMTLIFIRLFRVQREAFEYLMKWFYRLTFALMPVVILQYAVHKPLLFGLVSEYEGVLRDVPVFFPLCLLNLWIIGTKILTSEKVAAHEWVYAVLALSTVALSFTRGIYISVMVTAAVLLYSTWRDGTLKASSLIAATAACLLAAVGLLATGLGDKVVGRAASGIDLLGSGETQAIDKKRDDTFNGRLGLAMERFALVSAQNPLLGYGFIHEDDVPSGVRSRLKFGTPLGGTAADPTAYSRTAAFTSYSVLGFYTADIAWPDIVISVGWVGAILFTALLISFIVGHYRSRNAVHPMGYAVKTGLYLQVVTMIPLMLDGNYFYTFVHIPAFLLAGYSLASRHRAEAKVPKPAMKIRPANLLR